MLFWSWNIKTPDDHCILCDIGEVMVSGGLFGQTFLFWRRRIKAANLRNHTIWFKVSLEKVHNKGRSYLNQYTSSVVGHSVAECYRQHFGENEPALDSAGCGKGLIRKTPGFASVCVDGGMYLGARSYLEISSAGEFIAHEEDGVSEIWQYRNLIDEVCKA